MQYSIINVQGGIMVSDMKNRISGSGSNSKLALWYSLDVGTFEKCANPFYNVLMQEILTQSDIMMIQKRAIQ